MTASVDSEVDKEILLLSIKALTQTLDDLVGECMDAEGKPKTPSYRALMSARGALPQWCKHPQPTKVKK